MTTFKASGNDIAFAAEKALTAPGYETQAGYCQKWTRQVIQHLYGSRFDQYWRASAIETMKAFKGTPYALPVDTPLQKGDILYKGNRTSGKFGHVGIVVSGGKVAENSSSHINPEAGDNEARGTRTIKAFGPFEMVVRLSKG
jgi:cell wall-associated NlpC family hydrolase